MKTKKLKYTPEYNFELLGIHTSENDYKLSWLMSKCFDVEFCKREDLKIYDKKNSEELSFSIFENCTKNEIWNLKIISNKGTIGFFIPELKNIDYFLLVLNKDKNISLKDISNNLKQLDGINGVLAPDIQKLKTVDRLIFVSQWT